MKLYRYENIETPYRESREGIVSKKKLIGSWFTSKKNDLPGYIFMREPGGNILEVDVLDGDLEKYDATILPETKNMDIEKNNYILPKEIIETANIVKLNIESKLEHKFLFSEMKKIEEFVSNCL